MEWLSLQTPQRPATRLRSIPHISSMGLSGWPAVTMLIPTRANDTYTHCNSFPHLYPATSSGVSVVFNEIQIDSASRSERGSTAPVDTGCSCGDAYSLSRSEERRVGKRV